jgi:hypothetical protein
MEFQYFNFAKNILYETFVCKIFTKQNIYFLFFSKKVMALEKWFAKGITMI